MSVRRPFSSPEDPADSEDQFAQFVSEPSVPAEVEEKTDWLAEFPDEKTADPQPVRSKSWLKLSRFINADET
jgi:hypothetical protein